MRRRFFWRITLTTAILTVGIMVNSVQAIEPATSLTVAPTEAALTADGSQVFTATAHRADGSTENVTSGATWSTNDPQGSLTGSTYQAGKAGEWRVQAVFESLTAQSSVTVKPGALKELAINPNSDPEFIDRDAKRRFRTQGFDQHDNVVTGFTVVWSVIGDIGVIDQAGLFTAQKVGTGKIQAASGQVVAQIAVVVNEPPTANANTNQNGNVNASANANIAKANTNARANANTNQGLTNVSNTNAATGSPDTDQSTRQCKTLANWLWVLILIVFLLGVAILYALVPVTKIWPAIVGLGGAIVLIVVQRNYGCNLLSWWAWVMSLGTLGLTVLALRQMPSPKPPSP